MLEILSMWWPVLPSIIAVASVIAKITPNQTDDKIVAFVLKFIDALALTTGKTIKLSGKPNFID